MEKPQSSRINRFVVPVTILLTFISFWRAAAIVLSDLGSSAYYVGGIAEKAIVMKNPPGEQRCQPADSRTIQFMVKEHSAGELDQCRLDQKGYWRMGKGKIAIWDVAERYSV